ncbi:MULTISPECIES: LCP family protein [unclassified Frankia]|uniref:LCP family protein n=1 Tax=unclassified Frankia TaxID=2632575 RepID=UPI002AD31306|nr:MULTISPECIES: LCP family protein [unclassified Frankia]
MTANRRQVAAGVGGADAVTVSPDTHVDPPADPPQEPSDDLHADDLHADDPRADDAPAQRSLFQKLALALAAVVSMAVLAVSGGGYVVYRYFDAQITRVPLGLDEAERPAEAPPGTENFLLVGSDSREGTGNQYQSDEVVSGQRSDTTMIAHLDANGTTTLVSFPRDTLVTIPGHGRNKLNAAITIGGPSLLIRTLENLTNIKIDHFVSIDLAGFKAMTDAIGGVTICVRPLPGGSTSNLHDEWSQWHGVVGENHLNGEQALAFVRQRYGLPDGDFDRIRRQQQFISTVFQKATSNGVLANPAKLEGLLASATGALTVDDGTTVDDLRNLANRLRGMSTDAISFETIPVREPTRADGANSAGELRRFGSVQLYDPGQLDTFLAPLRGHGTVAPNPTGTPGTLGTPGAQPEATTVPPSAVTVDVLNGTTTSGLASSAARDLAAAGFRIARVASAEPRRTETTLVRYGPDGLAAARTLAAAIPGVELREDRSAGTHVTLVVGSDFNGIATQAMASAPAAGGDPPKGAKGSANSSPTPSPAPTTPAVTATELTASCTF